MELKSIGIIESPFVTKFGIPRQAGLLPDIQYTFHFNSPFNREEYWNGLSIGQYIWVLFYFHQSPTKMTPTVRPPRLGGTKRMGVFATRSPHRPNPIGLSLVKICQLKSTKGEIKMIVSGGDFLDQSPIFDIRPYISQNERVDAPMPVQIIETKRKVLISPELKNAERFQNFEYQNFINNIINILELDPLPRRNSKQKKNKEIYKMKLKGPQNLIYDIHFKEHESELIVLKLVSC